MTPKAKKLLQSVGSAEGCCRKVSPRELKAAKELIDLGLAEAIPASRGRGELALTSEGVAVFDGRRGAIVVEEGT